MADTTLAAANGRRRDVAAECTVAVLTQALDQLADLPDHLLAVVRLRLAHPGASLRELAELHTPPLTKHAYAARLRRLTDRARRGRG